MEITRPFAFGDLILALSGRFDASSSRHFEEEIDRLLAAGHREVQLDMKNVGYLSSAGIRGLLKSHKSLSAAGGALIILKVSPLVQDVLKMAGLEMLLPGVAEPNAPQKAAPTTPEKPTQILHAGGRFDFLSEPTGTGAVSIKNRASGPLRLTRSAFGVAIGALGTESDWPKRSGEMIVAGGTAIYQPTDGATRPDDMMIAGDFVPEFCVEQGCFVEGSPDGCGHFEASGNKALRWSAVVETVLGRSPAKGCLLVSLAETDSVVGATLLKPWESLGGAVDQIQFPQVREQIAFTAESTHANRLALIVGIYFKSDAADSSDLKPQLRPLAQTETKILGHTHAAVFPYHPLARVDAVPVHDAITGLMQAGPAQTVLHLLADEREGHPFRESQLWRGSFWWMPIDLETKEETP